MAWAGFWFPGFYADQASAGGGGGASAADVWAYTPRTLTAGGVSAIQSGLALSTQVDSLETDTATIITYVDEIEARLTAIRAAALDNLDVAVSTRLAAGSYTAPPSAATTATAVRAELATELGRVDVAISTRESESSAATRATTDQTEHDATQAAIAGIGGGGLTPTQDARLILVEQILRNKLITDPTTGVMTLYDDAGAPLMTAQLYETASASQTYRGKGAERRERLV